MALIYFEEHEPIARRALQMWPVLCAWAVLRDREAGLPEGLISYDRAGQSVRLPAQRLARVLGFFGLLCGSEDIPRLNANVVRKDGAESGVGANLARGIAPSDEQRRVLEFDGFGGTAPDLRRLNHVHETAEW